MIIRILKDAIANTKRSVLLIGPRQVGKSTLIHSLNPDLSINLADELSFMKHSSDPGELARLISLSSAKTVFLDEVQRIPTILNTVQALVDQNKKLKFYLTGSSARKLKRGGVNLLPGRVINFKLGPLVASEMNYNFDSKKILSYGSLPAIYTEENSNEAELVLKSYAANYLKEEIKAEALTRNLEAFARFLSEATLNVGQFIDLSKLSRRARISRHAIPRYFEILEDTLIGYRVYAFEPLRESEDLIRHPKFYLFDNGVYNGILQNFVPSEDRIGPLSEQLVFTQIMHSSWSKNVDVEVSTFRSRGGLEVDFVVKRGDQITGVEVKSSDVITTHDMEGLAHFKKVYPKAKQLFILHMQSREEKVGSIWSLPWQRGIAEMGL